MHSNCTQQTNNKQVLCNAITLSLPSYCFIEPRCQPPWLDSTGDGQINMQHWWNDTDRGNQSMPEEICLSTTVSTINPIWPGSELNLGLDSNRSMTNHFDHGTAYQCGVPESRVWLQIVAGHMINCIWAEPWRKEAISDDIQKDLKEIRYNNINAITLA